MPQCPEMLSAKQNELEQVFGTFMNARPDATHEQQAELRAFITDWLMATSPREGPGRSLTADRRKDA